MKEIIKRTPLQVCEVLSAVVFLGNFLRNFDEKLYFFCGIISFVILFFATLKMIISPGDGDITDPANAVIATSFTVSVMMLSVFAEPLLKGVAFVVWIMAILFYVSFTVSYTLRFVSYIRRCSIYSSFVVYSGFYIIILTADVFGLKIISKYVFKIAVFMFFCVVALVIRRYIGEEKENRHLQPGNLSVAPVSLIILAYLECADSKIPLAVLAMYAVSVLIYVIALREAVLRIRGGFSPAIAVFAFPFAANLVASYEIAGLFGNFGGALWVYFCFQFSVTAVFLIYIFVKIMVYTLVIYGRKAVHSYRAKADILKLED